MRLMKMDIFIIFTLVTIFQASWSYYISNSKKTWSRSRDECEIATPTIQYSHKDLTVDMNGQAIEQEVWVGYYQQTALFEYIGCMSSDDLDIQIPQLQLGERDIGRCYSACSNSPFIGIQESKCYCLQYEPKKRIRKLGCNSACIASKGACGGHNFTSVYKMLTQDDSRRIPEKQDSKNCLEISIDGSGNKYYKWRRCSDELWVFCSSDSSGSVEMETVTKSWGNAATLCFQSNGYPIGYEDLRNVTFEGVFAWTGIVWSDVIYKYTDLEYPKYSSDISYGYLKYDSSLEYVLHFSKEGTRKYILCNDTPVRTETTKLTTIANDDNPSPTKHTHVTYRHAGKETTQLTTITSDDHFPPTKHTHVPTMTTERPSSTPLSNTQNTFVSLGDEIGKSHNDSSTKDTDIPVIVGVSASATLAVIVIVIIVIIIQRKKILCCTEGKQLTEVADHRNSMTTNPISNVNNSYELVDAEYIETAIKTTSDLCDGTYNMPEQEADEVNTNETTYDIAGTDRQTIKQEHDNIYNKLQSESSPIYDHTNDKSKTRIQASDDTYNTSKDISVNSGFKLGGNHAVGMNTIEESPYNHTNSDPFERKQVDNVYNTASFQ